MKRKEVFEGSSWLQIKDVLCCSCSLAVMINSRFLFLLLAGSVSIKTLPLHLLQVLVYKCVCTCVVLGGFRPLLWRSLSPPRFNDCEQLFFSLSQGLFAISGSRVVLSSCVRTESPAETLSRRSRHSQD